MVFIYSWQKESSHLKHTTVCNSIIFGISYNNNNNHRIIDFFSVGIFTGVHVFMILYVYVMCKGILLSFWFYYTLDANLYSKGVVLCLIPNWSDFLVKVCRIIRQLCMCHFPCSMMADSISWEVASHLLLND